MKVIADTNVILRLVLGDDAEQAESARKLLLEATSVAISRHVLCELVWVLRTRNGYSRNDVKKVIHALTQVGNFVVNSASTEAGLAMLERGGDFADGVIAWEGRSMGGNVFASFDKTAVRLLAEQGIDTHLVH